MKFSVYCRILNYIDLALEIRATSAMEAARGHERHYSDLRDVSNRYRDMAMNLLHEEVQDES